MGFDKANRDLRSLASYSKSVIKPTLDIGYAFQTIAKIVISSAKSMLNAFSSFETLKTKLSVVTGSAEQGLKVFEKFKDFAKISPFGVEEITTAGIQLMQVGTSLGEIETVIGRISDIAGGDKDIFNRIVTNYTQIMSAGKATAMDIRQFAYMGIPIYKILDDLGVKGVATAQDVKRAFEVMTSEGGIFFKGNEKQAGTLLGQFNKLKKTWTEFLAIFTEKTGFGEDIKNMVSGLSDLLDSLNTFMESDKGGVITKFLFGNMSMDMISWVINAIGDATKNSDYQKETEQMKTSYKNGMYSEETPAERIKIIKRLLANEETNMNDEFSAWQMAIKEKKDIESIIKGLKEEPQTRGVKTRINVQENRLENINKEIARHEEFYNKLKRDLAIAEQEQARVEAEEQYANDLKNARKLILKEYGETAKAKKEETEELIKTLNDYKTKFAKDLSAEELAMIDAIIAELRAKAGREAEKQRKKDLKENNWWKQLQEDVYKGFMETVPQIMEINKKKKQGQELTPEERKLDASWNGGGKKELTAQTLMYMGFSTLGEATSGTDAGTFFQTYAKTGSWIISIIETVIGGIVKVLMSIEGFEEMLNGITELFSRFKPILKPLIEYLSYLTDSTYAVFNIIDLVMNILEPFVKLVGKIGQLIAVPARALGLLFTSLLKSFEEVDFFFKNFSEWVDDAFEWLDLGMEKQSQEEEELERLKELNEALSSLTQEIKDQEEYYLKKKMEINADTYKDKVLNVNDMILTPQGKFSTHPDDYLIATKNPYSLGGGNVVMNVNVTNNASDVVDASVEQRESANGTKELVLMISRKVANDYATGSNGWDSAYNSRVSRMNGRRLTT